jgi:predicted dehydrogenase
MKPRIGVIGAGHLGNYHIQKLAAEPLCTLAGFVEPRAERRAELAARYQPRGFASPDELRPHVDAVVIAAPTRMHVELGLWAFEHGLHVLIEKPIATSVAEGERLVAAAKARGLVLQVGQTERFNPAVAAALAVCDRPGYVVTERLGPFSGRSGDVDVVLDLMIHDLDIIASLVKSELVEARAIGVPVLTSEVDMCAARLQFADGTVAQLSAGRASLEPVRKIRLFTRERYLSIDCQSREVKSVRRLPGEPGSAWPQISGEPVEVPEGDALTLQDRHFVECVRDNQSPRVDGAAGVRAVALAEAVKKAMTVPGYPD